MCEGVGARRAMDVFDETAVVAGIPLLGGRKREGWCGMGVMVSPK